MYITAPYTRITGDVSLLIAVTLVPLLLHDAMSLHVYSRILVVVFVEVHCIRSRTDSDGALAGRVGVNRTLRVFSITSREEQHK